MRRAGLAADRCYPGDWSSASGYAAGRRLVADGLPTAVFAANDQMALGVLAALAEAGLRFRATCRSPASTTCPTPPTSRRR